MYGLALKILRKHRGMKQITVSRLIDRAVSAISRIESEGAKPTLEFLELYSNVFHIPVSSIVALAENLSTRTKGSKMDEATTRIYEWSIESGALEQK